MNALYSAPPVYVYKLVHERDEAYNEFAETRYPYARIIGLVHLCIRLNYLPKLRDIFKLRSSYFNIIRGCTILRYHVIQ